MCVPVIEFEHANSRMERCISGRDRENNRTVQLIRCGLVTASGSHFWTGRPVRYTFHDFLDMHKARFVPISVITGRMTGH